jgi:D-tyrosyl-tRNA(Tyr) deacylase
MRVVIQRVSEASVMIGGSVNGAIRAGLLVLLAVETADGSDDVDWLVSKIVRLRVFNDAAGLMNLSVREIGGDVLLVSQFTLLASTRKGNRPSYSRAARPEIAKPLYDAFRHRLEAELQRPVKSGEFGADMQVQLINDGPVTIVIDSRFHD